MPRYMTVAERSIRAIETALKTITVNNGYNVDVKAVHRRRDTTLNAINPPEIFLMFGNARATAQASEYSADVVTEEMEMKVVFIAPSMGGDQQDIEYNLFRGDIQRVLTCFAIQDALGTKSQQLRITYQESRPHYDAHQGYVEGSVDFMVMYRYQRNDPRLWPGETAKVALP